MLHTNHTYVWHDSFICVPWYLKWGWAAYMHVCAMTQSYMSHAQFTYMYESYHTCALVMSHIWMSHVTHMNESCHTYEWVMAHIWMSHVTHRNDSCHTSEWDMSHTCLRHVTHWNESCHILEWVMTRNESCHILEWVMARIWMSHVTHLNGSCQTESPTFALGGLKSKLKPSKIQELQHTCDPITQGAYNLKPLNLAKITILNLPAITIHVTRGDESCHTYEPAI